MTDSASTTKIPPTITSRISCLVSTAMVPERPPQRERSDVPHEDLGRIRVVPEEAESGSDHGAAQHGQLAGAHHARNLQIGRQGGVSGDVGEEHIGGGIDRHRSDGESVKSVGKVDRVAGADNHQSGKRDEPDPEVRVKVFE